jgi:hypothetical protein
MRTGVRALVGVLVLCLGVGWLCAEDPKKDEPAARPRGTLPKFFKGLGLSDDQKRDVYRVQARYRGKIDALLEQVRLLRKEEAMEIEKLLTAAQKDRLRELKLGEADKPADKVPAEKKEGVKPLKLVPEDKKP